MTERTQSAIETMIKETLWRRSGRDPFEIVHICPLDGESCHDTWHASGYAIRVVIKDGRQISLPGTWIDDGDFTRLAAGSHPEPQRKRMNEISFESAGQREDWRRRMERAPCPSCDSEKLLMLGTLDAFADHIATLQKALSGARAELEDERSGRRLP